MSYSSLTSFCRRHKIGVVPKKPAGRYHFAPGEEMQHDTSPHDVKVGDKMRRLQCASLVLCYSRMIYAQCYPTYNRLWARSFLTDALTYFGGAADKCMVDNSSVIVIAGSGPDAIFAAELNALGERFNFGFIAHAIGDANRSARVERPFHYIENNFYPGRTFGDLPDLNAQFRAWCDTKNASYKKHLRTKPIELFVAEKPHLKPLPAYIPEVYELLYRIVDIEGYVTLHSNRYSVPIELLSRRLAVHFYADRLRIFDGHRLVAKHVRVEDRMNGRQTLEEHRTKQRWHQRRDLPELPEEKTLRAASPQLATFVTALRKKHSGRVIRPLRRLHRMYLDYPSEPLCAAISEAMQYNLFDLDRIEKMVLKRIAGDFFRLEVPPEKEDNDG
ncbi:MAG: IS21 family transposase [Deltaproteobacteria bacterium]|nr:IS21 family transposase [Deltaproteobacteria bacterium]